MDAGGFIRLFWLGVLMWRKYILVCTLILARKCEYYQTKCADNAQCIHIDDVCDGNTDCIDESDENAVTCKGICFTVYLLLIYRYASLVWRHYIWLKGDIN